MSTVDPQEQLPSDSSDATVESTTPDNTTESDAAAAPEMPQPQAFDSEFVTVPREPDLYQRSLANAVYAARCADEMRAKDVVVLDMTKIASIVDFFVIATGTSQRQMNAIADEVNRKLKGELGNARFGVEGYRTEANWLLMDFGDVVLHVFTKEGRELYDLENLKADAERIDWAAQPESSE